MRDSSHAKISAASPGYQSTTCFANSPPTERRLHSWLTALRVPLACLHAASQTSLPPYSTHTHTHTRARGSFSRRHTPLWSAFTAITFSDFILVSIAVHWSFDSGAHVASSIPDPQIPVRLNPFHVAWPPLLQQSAPRRLRTPDVYLLLSWTQRKRPLSPAGAEDRSLIQESKVTRSYLTRRASLRTLDYLPNTFRPGCYQNCLSFGEIQFTSLRWNSGDVYLVIWTRCFMSRQLQSYAVNIVYNSESACSHNAIVETYIKRVCVSSCVSLHVSADNSERLKGEKETRGHVLTQ